MAKVIYNPVAEEGMQLYPENEGGTLTLTQYDTDPTASTGDAWVLHTLTGEDGIGGTPRGMLLALTYSGGGTHMYQFSYKTNEGNIKRTTLS